MTDVPRNRHPVQVAAEARRDQRSRAGALAVSVFSTVASGPSAWHMLMSVRTPSRVMKFGF